MKAHLLIYLALISPNWSWGASTAPECSSRPEFVTRTLTAVPLKSLPHKIFVGREAEYYVESKTNGLKLWGAQSFTKGKSQIHCATPGKSTSQSFSLYAPTLIDLSDGKTIGHSYWQFRMIANPKQFGIWNQKSRVFSRTADLESGLAKTGGHAQFVQHGTNDYELLLTRETEISTEVLSIRFDVVSNLK